MKRKLFAAMFISSAIALTVTAACTDNNTDDYLSEIATTEATTETTVTTEPTTQATTASRKFFPQLENTYSGTYVAEQGLTALDLSIFDCNRKGKIQALFSFHEDPSNKGVPSGSYLMEGIVEKYDGKNTVTVEFKGTDWEKKPDTYHIIEFTAEFDIEKGTVNSKDYEMKLTKSAGSDLSFLLNEYTGVYRPDTGDNRVDLTVERIGDHGDIYAVFEYEPEIGKKASFETMGQVSNIASDGRVTVSFKGIEWVKESESKVFIDFEGVFTSDGKTFTENGGHNILLTVK